jgi:peptidoglycan/xylan/chitin deacetylase (PgdA/CDA1 family)
VIAIGMHDVVDDLSAADPIAEGHTTLYTIERQLLREYLTRIQACVGRGGVSTVDRSGGSVFLTFDDGARSAYTCVADECERAGCLAHFFITTDWIGRKGFLDCIQIRELQQRGHVVGSHSRSHPDWIDHLSPQPLFRQWAESCNVLSDILGAPVHVASVPGGFYSRRVAEAAARAGITVLFTSHPTTALAHVDGCVVMGRYIIRRTTSPQTVAAIASGAWGPRFRQEASWRALDLAKRVTGRSYLTIRKAILGHVLQ